MFLVPVTAVTVGTKRLRDLHRERPDATTRPVDENTLAGPDLGMIADRLERGHAGVANFCRLDMRDVRRLRHEAALARARVFRPRSGTDAHHDITRSEGRHV